MPTGPKGQARCQNKSSTTAMSEATGKRETKNLMRTDDGAKPVS
jgi:hypothetical protein